MRNLKRALSLAVASVMLLGMMVVGSGAASYADVTSEHNTEAIEVLQAVGVMVGDDQGNFNPDQNVTRGEMAAIMSNLLDLGIANYVGAPIPFTDVPDWAHAYVAACYANGITGGTSATTYGTDEPVTAVQAGLMMLKALGYFQYQGDFDTNGGWILGTIRQAAEIGLYDGIDAETEAPLTRNEIAQLALNTLESDLVRFTGDLGMDVDMGNGQSVTVGFHSEYTSRTSSDNATYDAIDKTTDGSRSIMQLGEDLYDGNLKKDDTNPDDMGRPANTWTYRNDPIGKYSVEADFVVVVDKAQSVADEVEDINRNYGFGSGDTAADIYLNGDDNSGAYDETMPLKVGDVVEIFMDDTTANLVDTVAVTQYTVDQLTADVVTRGEGSSLEVRLPGVIGYTNAEDVKGYQGLAEDDVVYYYQDEAGVYHFAKAESFEGELTGSRNGTPTKYIISGNDYVINGNVGSITGVSATPDYNTTYRYYLDNNGYLIFAEKIEDATSDYVVVQDLQYAPGTGGISGSAKVEARIVKMDGTTQVVTIDSIDDGTNVYTGIDASDTTGNNGDDKYLVYDTNGATAGGVDLASGVKGVVDKAFFTYTTNSDDEYALTKVEANSDGRTTGTLTATKIENDKATVAGSGTPSSIAVSNSTVFIIADKTNDDSFTVYTGRSNVPDVAVSSNDATLAYVAQNGVASYVYVDSYGGTITTGDAIFILTNEDEEVNFTSEKDGDTTLYYNNYLAVVDGQVTTVKVKADRTQTNVSDAQFGTAGLYEAAYDSDGLITDLDPAAEGASVAYGYEVEDGVLMSGGNYAIDDSAPVYIVNEDGDEVEEATAAELRSEENDAVYVVKTGASDMVVDYVVIREMDDSETGLSALSGDNSLPTLDPTKTEQTVAGVASTAYTITATASDSNAVVEFSADGSTGWAVANGTVNKVTLGAAGSGDKSIWIRVTAVDDSTQIYKITITCPTV